MNKRFKPQYLPHNSDAQALVSALSAELGLTLTGKTGAKHNSIIASFLYYAQTSATGTFITWSGGTTSQDTTGFSFFPAAGAATILKVRDRLVQAGYLTDVDDLPSGLGNLSNKEARTFTGADREERIKRPNSYRFNAKPLLGDPRLASALFVDAQRPYVMVNRPESYTDKQERKAERRKAPKMPYDAVYKGKQRRRASDAANTVREMNAYWAQHPLTLPATNSNPARLYACATRIFHDGSLTSGGRWYGGWTNLKSNKRPHMQIDGEAISEIDLNGSQPTLFSALLGVRMHVGDPWDDVYGAVVQRLDADEEPKLLRMMVKQVIVEMLGTGNYKRTGPASTKPPKKPLKFDEVHLFFDTDHSKGLYLQIQQEALHVFPALKQLDTGYHNASGFLSYHEAEILTQTVIKLKGMDVVAYGVHDCVMVKQSDRDVAVATYRQVIRDYVIKHQKEHKHPRVDIEVSLTIEELDLDKVTLSGRYLQ